MNRKPQLTKRERKASAPARPATANGEAQHIHCIACGAHLDQKEFAEPKTATILTCNHGSQFPSCVACEAASRKLLVEHDRTGQPVKSASAWH
jgi:NAD-dependent SIR2 family protein deacetylase